MAYEINFQMVKNDTTVNALHFPIHRMYTHLQYGTDGNSQLTELFNTSLDIPANMTLPR